MQQSGVQRLILLSAFGVGESESRANCLAKLAYRSLVKSVYQDKQRAEHALENSALCYTKIYPVVLNDAPLADHIDSRPLGELHKVNGLSKVPRANVAKAMLDCLQDPTTYHQTLVVASEKAMA